jgi:archaellum component FlaC
LAIATAEAAKELEELGETNIELRKIAIEAEILFDKTLFKTGFIEQATAAAAVVLELDLFKVVGRNITQGIIVGLEEGQDALNTSLTTLLGEGFRVATGPNGIDARSPSRLAANVIGFPIPEGIAAGITAGLPLVSAAMQNVGTVVGRGFAALDNLPIDLADLISKGFTPAVKVVQEATQKVSDTLEETVDRTDRVTRSLTALDKNARGAKKSIEELDLVINDLQRSLLQEFKIFDFQISDPFRSVVFDEARKELNNLLTSIGGVADQFAKGLRDGTIAGVAQAANAFGEFEQKVIEGLREGIIEGSIKGVDDVNRTLDQIGIVVAQQLGPKNQAAIDEFDKLIGNLRKRSDIEALIIVELEQKALRDAQKKLEELNAQIANLGSLTSRVFRGLLTQLERQFDAAQQNLTSLFDAVFKRAQLPTGPLGLPDIGVIEDYAKLAADALTGIFERLLGRKQ